MSPPCVVVDRIDGAVVAVLVNLLQMTGSDIMDVAEHEDGADAFFLAESAIEQAAASWDNGTACVDLDGGGNVSFGEGTFSIDTAALQSDGQCRVNVTGTVNSAVRKLQADIQLGCGNTGWAVSYKTSTAVYWNGSAWSGVSIVDDKQKDVHCVRKSEAWSVHEKKKIYRYSGGSWALHTTLSNKIYSVHCITESECWAAGESGKFYHWTGGASWSELTDSLGKEIYSVFCVTTSDCWAVGESGQVYRWTGGSSWSRPQTLDGDKLYSVHCTGSSDCWSVNEKGKFFQWNGSTWSEHSQLADEKELYSVHCVSSNDCWAVGKKDSDARVARYTGGDTWSITTPGPGTAPAKDLNNVYCTTTNDCWAVGKKNGSRENFVRWDGTSWGAQAADGNIPNKDFEAIHITQPTAVIEWSEVVQ